MEIQQLKSISGYFFFPSCFQREKCEKIQKKKKFFFCCCSMAVESRNCFVMFKPSVVDVVIVCCASGCCAIRRRRDSFLLFASSFWRRRRHCCSYCDQTRRPKCRPMTTTIETQWGHLPDKTDNNRQLQRQMSPVCHRCISFSRTSSVYI